MKVGSLVFATDSGLGILAKSFYDNGIITHPYVVAHPKHPNNWNWFPNAPRTHSLRQDLKIIQDWASDLDILLGLETFFLWDLIPFCRKLGIKTVLCPMYECMVERYMPSKNREYACDLYLCPSLLDIEVFGGFTRQAASRLRAFEWYSPNLAFTPIPVSVPWKQREQARVFVHNAGHGGLQGRNGTRELCDSLKYVESAAKVIIRSQAEFSYEYEIPGKSLVEVEHVTGTVPYESLYSEGDVFIFPEKHNGLSLPIQEAYASGMLVMAGNRFPMNTWLPEAPLIPVEGYRTTRIGPPYLEFDQAIYDPKKIAERIDYWYDRPIWDCSLMGKAWAEENSWEKLGPKYLQLLEGLL